MCFLLLFWLKGTSPEAMSNTRALPAFFAAIFAFAFARSLLSFIMEGKNAYFEAALASIPPAEAEILKGKRLGYIEVLGNLPPAKIQRIFGTPSEELQKAIDLAMAITDGDLQRIEQIGLPKPKKIKITEPISAISSLSKIPLN